MNYKKMNGTGIKVSEMCLGTMTFGAQTDMQEAEKIVNHALDKGINFFDTADGYNGGESERILGKILEGRRDHLIVASKVRYKAGDELNNNGLNRRHILKQIDNSLKSLRTDYLDIYYMHAMDPETDIEESLDTMSGLVRSGKVRYLGVSNFPSWQVAEILWLCDKRNYVRPIVTQNIYNVISREVEYELMPLIKKYNIGLAAYNPIAGGMLSGKYDFANSPEEGTRFGSSEVYINRYWMEDKKAAVTKLKEIADQNGMSLLELSMKWCLSNKQADSIICGVSRLSQIEQNIAALEGNPLNDKVKAACDSIGAALMRNRVSYFKN